ncbi:unnamed protein product, partial [Bubo scandiacus]
MVLGKRSAVGGTLPFEMVLSQCQREGAGDTPPQRPWARGSVGRKLHRSAEPPGLRHLEYPSSCLQRT